jgi:hypothetical protein
MGVIASDVGQLQRGPEAIIQRGQGITDPTTDADAVLAAVATRGRRSI